MERQVTEMLRQGIIQPSASPFVSLVLLVPKKYGTWHFYVDHHHLNAITINNCYPLLIIEELLDELAGSQWFISLDLRMGYHQIWMKPEDEHKTTFKTHHYEFKVMLYGLTSAPATFQGLMNTIMGGLIASGSSGFHWRYTHLQSDIGESRDKATTSAGDSDIPQAEDQAIKICICWTTIDILRAYY